MDQFQGQVRGRHQYGRNRRGRYGKATRVADLEQKLTGSDPSENRIPYIYNKKTLYPPKFISRCLIVNLAFRQPCYQKIGKGMIFVIKPIAS